MTIDKSKLLESILESLERTDYIRTSDIPNIPLYMDQVTTFMDRHMSPRNNNDEHVLTKTMINNYAKNDLLPAPEKKKYSKEHIIMLIFIYYFKNVMSINDIKTVLDPISLEYFNGISDSLTLEDIYEEIAASLHTQMPKIKEDIIAMKEHSETAFADTESGRQEFLRTLTLICMLSFDVYAKKQLIESIVNEISAAAEPSEESDKAKEKEKKKTEKKEGKEHKEKKEKDAD